MYSKEEAMAELQRRQASRPSEGESAVRGAFDTLTLGFGPKVGGAIGAAGARLIRPDLFEDQSFGQTYEQGRDYLREQNNIAAEENPWSYGLGGLAGGVLNPVGRGVNTVKGAAGVGTGLGAAYGLGSSDAGPVGEIVPENLAAAGVGAGLGGALGGAAQYGLNKILPSVAKGVAEYKALTPEQKIAGMARIPAGGGAPPVAEGPAVAAAIDPSQKALELSKQFNVPLTKGQASQDLSQMTLEDLLASGAKGSEAANIINSARAQGSEAFQGAAQNVRKTIGGDEFVEKGQSLKGMIDKVTSNAKAGDAKVKEAYQVAKDNVGFLDLKDVKGFRKIANARMVEEALTPDNAPAAFSQLKAFDKIFSKSPKGAQEVDFKRIEAYRQGLNRAYRSAQGQDKYGINLLKNQFDDYLDNTIETALVRGNPNVLEQFKGARKFAADWKQKYTAGDKSEFGKKFIQDIVENSKNSREPYTYSMISDKIFGANKYGFKPQAVGIVKEIKNHVGADSPEFNGLKLDAVQKVIKPLLNQKGEVNFNNPYVQTYKNNLKENESVLKELLSKDELKQLYDLGDLGSFMYQSKKSTGNPSQSGIVKALSELPMVQRALGLPLVKEIPEAYSAYQAKSAVSQAGLEKGVEALRQSKLPKAPVPNSNIAPATGLSADSLISALAAPPRKQEEKVAMPAPSAPAITKDQAIQEMQRRQAMKQQQPQAQIAPQQEGPVNAQLLNRIAHIESGGNPNARATTSSASGLYQFTNPTWRDAVDRYGAQTGITYGDKNNPQAQRVMAKLTLDANSKDLSGFLGRNPQPAEVYLTHFLGLSGAKSLLSANPNQFAAQVLPTAAKANRSVFFKNGRPITVAELYGNFNRKINSIKV